MLRVVVKVCGEIVAGTLAVEIVCKEEEFVVGEIFISLRDVLVNHRYICTKLRRDEEPRFWRVRPAKEVR